MQACKQRKGDAVTFNLHDCTLPRGIREAFDRADRTSAQPPTVFSSSSSAAAAAPSSSDTLTPTHTVNEGNKPLSLPGGVTVSFHTGQEVEVLTGPAAPLPKYSASYGQNMLPSKYWGMLQSVGGAPPQPALKLLYIPETWLSPVPSASAAIAYPCSPAAGPKVGNSLRASCFRSSAVSLILNVSYLAFVDHCIPAHLQVKEEPRATGRPSRSASVPPPRRVVKEEIEFVEIMSSESQSAPQPPV